MPYSNSGPYGGLPPPIPVAGMGFLPYGYTADGGTKTMTNGIMYISPWPIFRTQSFSGSQFYESGAGNTGNKMRIGLYAEALTGGPGTLLKDFGEVSMSGSAAVRQSASAYTAIGPQMCYIVGLSNASSLVASMNFLQSVSSVGLYVPPALSSLLGDFSGARIAAAAASSALIGWTASQTYGALPSTAPTPTGDFLGGGGNFPALALYI